MITWTIARTMRRPGDIIPARLIQNIPEKEMLIVATLNGQMYMIWTSLRITSRAGCLISSARASCSMTLILCGREEAMPLKKRS